jgi:hypothetical protein
LSDLNEARLFLDRFLKNTEISDLIKMCPVGAELFHADRLTDVMKLIVVFRNFLNIPKYASEANLCNMLASRVVLASVASVIM